MENRCYSCMKLKTQSPVCEHCGFHEQTKNPPHQLAMGTVLRGQYLVGKVLGQGGFGITYMGWDQFLETPVAIKEYYPNGIVNRNATQAVTAIGNGDMEKLFYHNRDRFLREARILARLSNVPGIVRVHNLFGENNTAYIIMEYVAGTDLRRHLLQRGRCLSVEQTLRFLMPVMEALQKVHEAGLVHRDISPDNIMILSDGTAKLLDFGAARDVGQADVNQVPSQSTEAILKHGFAPLEQYRRRGSLGPWTDVYALCATIYYCLTGTVPADAPERVMGDDNVNWAGIPGLTARQIQVLKKGMELMPENRVASVAELLAGLRDQAAPVEAAPVQPPVVPVRPSYMAENIGSYPLHTQPVKEPTVTPKKETPPEDKPKPEPPKPKPKKPIGLILGAVLGVIAVVAAAWLLLPKPEDATLKKTPEETSAPATEIVQTEPTETVQTEPEDPQRWKENVLMYDNGDWSGTSPVLGSSIPRYAVTDITFLDTLVDVPADSWDVSRGQNGKVLAWVEKNGIVKFEGSNGAVYSRDVYSLYIAADGGIQAASCAGLFSGYTNVTKINFNDCFHTDKVYSMSSMFAYCESLESLDVSSFNTSHVGYMGSMFQGCISLESVDLSSFDTSRVTDMGQMFYGCSSLESVDLSSFNTSRVTGMGSMFSGCSSLESVDLSSFDTSRVTYMGSMFQGCSSLESVDLSSFDTSQVTGMGYMFYRSPNLMNLELRNFDTSKVNYYEYFMDAGGKVNGRPWEELFQ